MCDFQHGVFNGSSSFVGGHVRNIHVSSSATGMLGSLYAVIGFTLLLSQIHANVNDDFHAGL